MATQPTEYYVKNAIGEYEPVHYKTDAGLVKVEDTDGFYSKDNTEDILGEIGACLAEIAQQKGTKQSITFNPDGTPKQVIYKNADGNVVRTDNYEYAGNTITETIMLAGGSSKTTVLDIKAKTVEVD